MVIRICFVLHVSYFGFKLPKNDTLHPIRVYLRPPALREECSRLDCRFGGCGATVKMLYQVSIKKLPELRNFNMSEMLKKIKTLIRRKDSCVLATTDGETPHCSLMAYLPGDSGECLFLVTSRASRKYQNMRRHPRVSLLIDTRGEQQRELTQALTVTGTCDFLQENAEIERVKAAFVRQHPHLDSFLRRHDMAVVCIQVDFFLLLDGPERAYHEILDK